MLPSGKFRQCSAELSRSTFDPHSGLKRTVGGHRAPDAIVLGRGARGVRVVWREAREGVAGGARDVVAEWGAGAG